MTKPQGLWAIPDIHGRFDLLTLLFNDLQLKHGFEFGKDKVVFLGDYVDRGDESKQVVDQLRVWKNMWPDHVIVLAGNHEWLMIAACIQHTEDDCYLWAVNGGDATLRSYGPDIPRLSTSLVPNEDVKWLAALPLFHEEPGFFFSHAPAPRENRRQQHMLGKPYNKSELTWTYSNDEFGVANDFGNGTIGVCGHIHALRKGIFEPRFYPHYIFADAGCGCADKAPLVAIEVRTREVVFAKPSDLPKKVPLWKK